MNRYWIAVPKTWSDHSLTLSLLQENCNSCISQIALYASKTAFHQFHSMSLILHTNFCITLNCVDNNAEEMDDAIYVSILTTAAMINITYFRQCSILLGNHLPFSSQNGDDPFITARKQSLGQGNIFIGMCQEFCSQGGSASVHAWIPPPPSGAGTPPRTRYPPGAGTPPGAEHTGRYGQRAGGTHPTGMQSCVHNIKYSLCFWTNWVFTV